MVLFSIPLKEKEGKRERRMKDSNLYKEKRRIQAKMDLIRLKTWLIALIATIHKDIRD